MVWECSWFLQLQFRSTHSRNSFLPTFLHFAAFAHGLHFSHDICERLLDGLLQQIALAFALHLLRVCQGGQGAVDVLQANGHSYLPNKTGAKIILKIYFCVKMDLILLEEKKITEKKDEA